MDDREIMKGISQGREEAFNYLWENNHARLYNYVCSNVKYDKDLAEDVVQEVFMHCLEKADQFHFKSKISTWLFSIAYKKCCRAFRKSGREVSLSVENPDGITQIKDIPCGQNNNPEKIAVWKQIILKYRQCLYKLNAIQRSAWILHREQKMSHDEIAEILHKSPNSTRILVSRAKSALLDCIGVERLDDIAS